jgi:hypothetical protein
MSSVSADNVADQLWPATIAAWETALVWVVTL